MIVSMFTRMQGSFHNEDLYSNAKKKTSAVVTFRDFENFKFFHFFKRLHKKTEER